MTHLWLSLAFGALIGLSLGLVGGGGSILTVPILVYAIGQPVHTATTTSLAIVGLNALTGVVGHARAGNVQVRTGVLFGGAGILGAFAGSWLGGKVFERTGAYDWVWYIDIVLAVGAALVHLPIREAPVAARSAAVGVAA